jgi:DNA-binding protein YbaB
MLKNAFNQMGQMKDLVKAQNKMKKVLQSFFVTENKGKYEIVVRGDKRVEKILVEGDLDKDLKDVINNAMKAVDKKAEKKVRGQMADLGIDLPGLK